MTDFHSAPIELGHGVSVEFRYVNGLFHSVWLPQRPEGDLGKHIVPAYCRARHEFLSEVAERRGISIVVADIEPVGDFQSGNVIPFKDVRAALHVSRDAGVKYLTNGRRVLVINTNGAHFTVTMIPNVDVGEAATRTTFDNVMSARQYAVDTQRQNPNFYQCVVDRTDEPLTQDDFLACGLDREGRAQ